VLPFRAHVLVVGRVFLKKRKKRKEGKRGKRRERKRKKGRRKEREKTTAIYNSGTGHT